MYSKKNDTAPSTTEESQTLVSGSTKPTKETTKSTGTESGDIGTRPCPACQ